MSGWNESPDRKSVVQVPDSSPVSNRDSPKYQHTRLFAKPSSGNGGSSLREKFAFNGTNILGSSGNTAEKLASRDIEILKSLFPTVSATMVGVVYKSKANRDIKRAKAQLAQIVENRKKNEQEQLKQSRAASAESSASPHSSSIQVLREEIEIKSSPDTSPQKLSSKVVLDKTKSIKEKYSATYKGKSARATERESPVQPQQKKRKLVRGTRNATPIIDSDVDENDELQVTDIKTTLPTTVKADNGKQSTPISLSDEEEELEEPEMLDTDDSDVDETTLGIVTSEDYWDEKVVEFMNTADVRDIADAAQTSKEAAQRVVEGRPYKTINHFESHNFVDKSSARKRKTDGEIYSQRVNLVLRGYEAVDSLVKQCNTYSESIANEIAKWGVTVHGVNDELEVVEVNVDDDDDDDDEVGVSKRRTKTGYVKDKPKLLADSVELKNYQQVGLNWLSLLYRNKLSCILADEMGLGKTCQVIAFLAHLKETIRPDSPHLVVVPASTLENWMREFNKFAPSLVVEPYYGSQSEREDMRYMLSEKWDNIDVVVTTYNLATSSKEDLAFLKSANFNVIVYDEGHMLKNSTTERFQKLMKLRAEFRLLLTGTPLQNNLRELMSLLEFILPSIFVSKKEDLKYVFTQKATTKDSSKDFNPLLSEKAISKAKKMMAPFILRRRKDQVLQHLPPKHRKIEYCELYGEQRDVYAREVEKGIKARESKTTKITNVLMYLRKAAIHPLLFRYHYDDTKLREMSKEIMKEATYAEANQQYIYEDMQVMTDFELHNLCLKFPKISSYQLDNSSFMNSGKVRVLERILPEIISKDGKVLIFSMFTQVLDILEVVLSLWSIKFLRLDGSTSVDMRQDLIDKFYEEDTIPVFLLSTRAGGFGINLVCANNVIVFDQSFNPHDDKQAEDRAHRVGQERPVTVTRLITKETIEESVYLLAQNKLELDMSMSGEQIESKVVSIIDEMVFEKGDPHIKGEVTEGDGSGQNEDPILIE